MKRLIALGILFSCGIAISEAAPEGAPSPKDPLLPRAPEFSSWTIVEKEGKQTPAPDTSGTGGTAPKEVRCTITKTGTTYREVSNDPERGESAKWVFDGLQIKQAAGAGRPVRIPRTKFSADFSDYLRSDFEPFEWIGRENYRGVQKYEDRPCHVFEVESGKKRLTPRERYERSQGQTESEKPSGEIPATNDPAHTLTAYLDASTQLPVALRQGERLTTYTFNPPPTAPLQPPADVLESFTKWRRAIQARNQPPPRP